MFNLLIRLVVSTVVVLGASNLLKGFHVANTQTAVIAAIVLGLLNTFLKPILQFLSIPITLLTLGLFYLVINVAMVYLAAYLVDGFRVDGFLTALIFSFALSLAQSVAGWFLD
jgi:putative membrane protein